MLTQRLPLSKRALPVVLAGLMVAGCSSQPDATGTAPGAGAATGTTTAHGAYPVTVHQGIYGPVQVKAKPAKIVSIAPGFSSMLVSLGVQPVASDIPVEQRNLPWFKGRLAGAVVDDMIGANNSGINAEKIMSYDPDVVVGGSFQLTKEAIQKMGSDTAVYAGRTEDHDEWTENLEDLSLIATGSTAKAKEVEATVMDAYAKTREQLPGVQGKSYDFVLYNAEQNQFFRGISPTMKLLGLRPVPEQSGAYGQPISFENMQQLKADVLAVVTSAAGKAKLQADPRFAKLPSSKNGSLIMFDPADPLISAIYDPSPEGLLYANNVFLSKLKNSALNGK